jgi:surface polysaccharide O-acyltransferase-like enzyme
LFVFFLPAAAIQVLLRANFPQHQNWSDFLLWMVYFIYGYLFLSDPRFLLSVRKQWKVALFTGLVCFTGMLVLLGPLGYAETWELNPTFSAGYAAYQVLRSLNSWAWVLFFLGAGMQRLNFKSEWLGYASEAVLPFYILHHVVIVALGYALFGWDPPILLKYLVLAGGALLITLGIYELLVRRVNALRFLFGMRLKS